MKSIIKGTVPADFSSKSLQDFLRYDLRLSSALIKKAKRIENGITVNGKLAFTNSTVLENDKVEVIIETDNEKSENILPCEIPLNIVFEDEYMLVVDKDGGVPTHPSLNNYDISVAGAVMNYYQKQGKNFVFRPVNRLDKGTSGLMIIAKNPYIHEMLKKQLHTGNFVREYKALVCGIIEGCGTVNAPIFRADNSIIKRAVDERGVYAVTHYRPIEVFKDKTLLSLKLETGRTHQIRVHMQYIGHPLYGDFLYGSEAEDLKRPALHSSEISFLHPISNKHLCFSSPLKHDIETIIKRR